MTVLSITHVTKYSYQVPVEFGDHQLMFRPRDGHDLRLLETGLSIFPDPASIYWSYDVFGNSIVNASFAEKSDFLSFSSFIRAEQFPLTPQDIVLSSYVVRYPWRYSADEIADLGRSNERADLDPEHVVDAWARGFVEETNTVDTYDLLIRMTQAIKAGFQYRRREEPGTQDATVTLAQRSGSCRDFALLMMEAVRSLGFADRFVSGYLYDDSLSLAGGGVTGGGETHAWLQIYLPGPGWVEFDPTNGLIGGQNLIRVAVARSPEQAAPLRGAFVGPPGSLISMDVDVTIAVE